jgi:hypothetical protein
MGAFGEDEYDPYAQRDEVGLGEPLVPHGMRSAQGQEDAHGAGPHDGFYEEEVGNTPGGMWENTPADASFRERLFHDQHGHWPWEDGPGHEEAGDEGEAGDGDDMVPMGDEYALLRPPRGASKVRNGTMPIGARIGRPTRLICLPAILKRSHWDSKLTTPKTHTSKGTGHPLTGECLGLHGLIWPCRTRSLWEHLRHMGHPDPGETGAGATVLHRSGCSATSAKGFRFRHRTRVRPLGIPGS